MNRLLFTALLFVYLIVYSPTRAQLFQEDFGSSFGNISTVKWPTTCRNGASSFNTSLGSCYGIGDYNYSLSGFGSYITTQSISIPTTGLSLSFEYSFDYFSFASPEVEIRSGATCGTTLLFTEVLAPTAGVCTPYSIDLSAYVGQTIYIRFVSNTSSEPTFIDDILVNGSGGSGPSGDYKWADNFNDNDLTIDFTGNDGDEACTGCGNWTLSTGATLELVPAGGWQGNSNMTEAFPDDQPNVYYTKLDRNEWIESPTIDMSGQESVKISFYAKSSSSGSGGGDSWSSFSDHLRLQIWDGSTWITVKDITEGAFNQEDQISSALPFNYFCFTAYKSTTSPGNYYYNTTPNVNSAYFHSNFKFRVVFEGGFSGAPFAWVDDFTFRADADGYSTMVPCGLSFWNEPTATSYGQDLGVSGNNNAEKGVELELDNSISFPPNWTTEANDGDFVNQIFGSGEAERVVFSVISEQRIQFAFPQVFYYAPSIGWQSTTLSIDNNYTGPGWKYYAVEYVSCDLASGSIAEPTDDFRYYYVFEYGNEFIPVFYHLNTSGIESGGGATSVTEVFNAPDVISTDECGTILSVNWLNFDVLKSGTDVDLRWTTATERNNDHFDVERSVDGLNFEKLSEIKGQGNSSMPTSYRWTDYKVTSPITYYRIKQVDFDGNHTFSEAKVVHSINALALWPNPVDNVLFIQSEDGIKSWRILKADGTEVKSSSNNNSSDLNIDVTSLPSGFYLIEIESENSVQQKRFVKN